MPDVRITGDRDYVHYHIHLSRNMTGDARVAIIPGAPERAELIARQLQNPRKLASHRGLDSWIGELDESPVLVVNTGMGGPTTEIVVQELAQLGVATFLRIGTTGAIQPHIEPGSLIITEASIRLDGSSDHYAPPCYPAAADLELTWALRQAARGGDVPVYSGITVSSASFYPGQERYDSASGHVHRGLQGSLEDWRKLGALNYEMESGTLLTMCRTMGLAAGCVCAVVANRCVGESVRRDLVRRAEERATEVGLAALRRVLGASAG